MDTDPETSESWALDLVAALLRRTGDLPGFCRHLVAELQALCCAGTVLLIECTPTGHRLLDCEPAARGSLAGSPAFQAVMAWSHDLRGIVTLEADEPGQPLAASLEALGSSRVLAMPLIVGERRIGVVIALDLPRARPQAGLHEALAVLAGVVALALNDSQLIRHQDRLIAERTERLQRSEAAYRALSDNLPDIISRYDREGRLLYVSRGITRTTGLEPEHFIGRRHAELGYSPEEVAFWDAAIAGVFASGEPFETSFELNGPKGHFELEWRLLPERDKTGAIVSVLAVARDITGQREAERNYSLLFNAMLDGFALHEIVCDATGAPVDYRFLAINPAIEAMTGLRAADLIGRTVLETMPQTERHWIETYGRVALSGEPIRFENFSQALAKHYEVMAYSPLRGRFATVFQDVTQRKELERQRQQTAKMEALGNLAGGIAHDFNNILQAIIGFAHLARRDQTTPRQEESLLAILQAGGRAAELVRQILAFARRDEQSQQPVLLQDLLTEVLSLLRSTVPATIELHSEIDGGCPPILAEPTAIHQVIMNLATNAVYAMRGGTGRLDLRLRQRRKRLPGRVEEGPCVQLAVGDTGCGMEAALLERIFEPFFTTKPQGEGTGMGLSMVQGIVARSGGQIEVESQPGLGTRFIVSFPALPPGQPALPAKAACESGPTNPGRGRQILFVDDEAMLRDLADEFLTDLGCVVRCCASPLEALALFEAEPEAWGLVVSDQTMPGLSGLELARRIKAQRPGLPIILCTGYSEDLDGEPRELGFDELLHKPYELGELLRRCTMWLREA